MAWDIGSFNYLLVAFTSIIAVMNPISTAAVYFALTEDLTAAERKKVRNSAIRIGLFVLVFFAITGQVIFFLFGLTVPAFKIAGGILLLNFATGMLRAKKEEYSIEELENIAIVPLAFPLTCGAGTITTVILLASEAGNIFETSLVFVAIGASIGISYLMMRYSSTIFRFIGDQEIRVIVRLLAIFVLAIAVQFFISGIGEALPQILQNIQW
ncbi:MAG: MarC family protein [Methanomicrobiaceae archaeon]|nr:MarC family protein [Methanomicrobiaceae archaeon]